MGCCDSKSNETMPKRNTKAGKGSLPVASFSKTSAPSGIKPIAKPQTEFKPATGSTGKDSIHSSNNMQENYKTQITVNNPEIVPLQPQFLPVPAKKKRNQAKQSYGIKTHIKDPFFSSYESDDLKKAFQENMDQFKKKSEDVKNEKFRITEKKTEEIADMVNFTPQENVVEVNQIQPILEENQSQANDNYQSPPILDEKEYRVPEVEQQNEMNKDEIVEEVIAQMPKVEYEAASQSAVEEVNRIIQEQTRQILQEYHDKDQTDEILLKNDEIGEQKVLQVVNDEEKVEVKQQEEQVVEAVNQGSMIENEQFLNRVFTARIVEEELGTEDPSTEQLFDMRIKFNLQKQHFTGIIPQDATAIVVGSYDKDTLESHFDITQNNKVEVVEGRFKNNEFTEFEGTLTSKHEYKLYITRKLTLTNQQY